MWLRGTSLLLLLGLATPGIPAGTPPPSTPEGARPPAVAANAALSRRFQGVWYRTPEKRGKLAAWLASGDLTVGVGTISFESKKLSLTIPTASIREVESIQFPDDPANAWIVIKYAEGRSARAAAFKDAGMGRGTEAIRMAFLSTWLSGEPAPATAPAEADIASAIESLHTTRLESLYYANDKVPKNVWRLVFTPGLDDSLLRAYRVGDRDDLFRFNLIMILNRRAVGLEGEEPRRKVYDCMLEAVRTDSFGWVKVEARDALRRLGADKAVLEEADALIKSQGAAESPAPPARP